MKQIEVVQLLNVTNCEIEIIPETVVVFVTHTCFCVIIICVVFQFYRLRMELQSLNRLIKKNVWFSDFCNVHSVFIASFIWRARDVVLYSNFVVYVLRGKKEDTDISHLLHHHHHHRFSLPRGWNCGALLTIYNVNKYPCK